MMRLAHPGTAFVRRELAFSYDRRVILLSTGPTFYRSSFLIPPVSAGGANNVTIESFDRYFLLEDL